jgi:DNA-directed RNA polymerase specialized sigma subunit
MHEELAEELELPEEEMEEELGEEMRDEELSLDDEEAEPDYLDKPDDLSGESDDYHNA